MCNSNVRVRLKAGADGPFDCWVGSWAVLKGPKEQTETKSSRENPDEQNGD